MKNRKTRLFVAIVCLAMCLNPNVSSSQDDHKELIAEVENGLSSSIRIKGESTWTIEERMKFYGVPGVSIAVIQGNKVIWTKAYGVKDRETQEPVTTETLFQCASISKPVSAAAALKMVEQGEFDLDADINEYLESWNLPENEFTKAEHVSLKHLISHRGGLTVHGFLGYSSGKQVPTLVELLDGKSPANSGPIRVDKLPGESFRYSGGGYCVMQQMMIDQTGKSFPNIMDELVLGPLGMTKSTYEHPLSPGRLNEAATGYLPNGAVVEGKQHTYPEMAPAGLWSNSAELAKYLVELQLAYHGKSDKLLSKPMARRMLDEQLGIFVRPSEGEYYFGHGGWNEGFSSDCKAHRDRGFGVVVLTNANQPPFIDEVVNSVAAAYQWPNVVQEFESLKINPDEVERFAGRYNRRGQLVKIYLDSGKLFHQTLAEQPKELVRVGEAKFVRRDDPNAVMFSANAETGQMQFAYQGSNEESSDREVVAKKMKDTEKLPIEWLESGDFKQASDAYVAAMKTDPTQRNLQEDHLNNQGYEMLNSNQVDFAIGIFRINTLLYPKSFNAWDSLGEGYMTKGETKKAIANYEKSVELNPDNRGAIEYLKKLRSR